MSNLFQRLRHGYALCRVHPVRLHAQTMAITLDSGTPLFDKELRPIVDRLIHHRIPVTMFMCNRGESGVGPGPEIRKLQAYCASEGVPIEIASHGLDHRNLAAIENDRAAEYIRESIASFASDGIDVVGFRSALLSTESRIADLLLRLGDEVPLRYDSSVCWESGLLSSLFHLVVGRKGPYRVGHRWVLPISALDDYHIFERMGKSERFALGYWVFEAACWLRRMSYCLLLFHPRHLIGRLSLFDALLFRLKALHPSLSFATCSRIADELDASYPVRSEPETRSCPNA